MTLYVVLSKQSPRSFGSRLCPQNKREEGRKEINHREADLLLLQLQIILLRQRLPSWRRPSSRSPAIPSQKCCHRYRLVWLLCWSLYVPIPQKTKGKGSFLLLIPLLLLVRRVHNQRGWTG